MPGKSNGIADALTRRPGDLPEGGDERLKNMEHISNSPSFHLKHTGVPDGSDGSDGTSYPLTKNYKLPVA